MRSNDDAILILIEKISSFEKRLSDIESKLDSIKKNTERMETHIDFVENTYDTIKTPFHFLMEKINVLSLSSLSPFKNHSYFTNKLSSNSTDLNESNQKNENNNETELVE